MKKDIIVIYWDSLDDACGIKGYIYGTTDEAEAYCKELNKDFEWFEPKYTWEVLDCLNKDMRKITQNVKRSLRVTYPDSAAPDNDPNPECPSECQLQ